MCKYVNKFGMAHNWTFGDVRLRCFNIQNFLLGYEYNCCPAIANDNDAY